MNIGKKIDIRMFIAVMVSLLSSFLLFTVNTYAAKSFDITVEYTPNEDALKQYKMEVSIEGDGYLLDGSQKISKQPQVYDLVAGTEKSFLPVPADGAAILSVLYDGEDITHKVKRDKRITVTGKDKDTVLKVTFSESGKQNVSTGDDKNITGYLVIALLSTFTIYIIMRKRKKQKTINSVSTSKDV